VIVGPQGEESPRRVLAGEGKAKVSLGKSGMIGYAKGPRLELVGSQSVPLTLSSASKIKLGQGEGEVAV